MPNGFRGSGGLNLLAFAPGGEELIGLPDPRRPDLGIEAILRPPIPIPRPRRPPETIFQGLQRVLSRLGPPVAAFAARRLIERQNNLAAERAARDLAQRLAALQPPRGGPVVVSAPTRSIPGGPGEVIPEPARTLATTATFPAGASAQEPILSGSRADPFGFVRPDAGDLGFPDFFETLPET